MPLAASHDDAGGLTFACAADAAGVLLVQRAGNDFDSDDARRRSSLLDLPAPCTAASASASGMVLAGTADGAVFAFHPGDDGDYGAARELYRHPERERVDAVEIARDGDTVVAAIGLNVVLISRVLLSSVVDVVSIDRVEIPRIPDRCKPAEAFHSISCQDDGTVLLCETGSRGGIVVLRRGKYYCHLMGCHENVDGRFSSRAFRFVGCGMVQQTANEDAFVVLGIENWGDLAVWVVDKRGKEGCALGVTRTWDVPMRGPLAVSLSVHPHAEGSDTLSFAVAYAASSMFRSGAARRDPGWVSVFAVPIPSLMSEDEELERRIAEAEGNWALTAELEKSKRKLTDLEQIDLDAFADRPEGCRHVDSLRFTADGRLLVACIGMLDAGWPVAGSACARIFERSEERGVNDRSCWPYVAVLHACPEWRKPTHGEIRKEGLQDVAGNAKMKAEATLYDEDY